MLNVAHKAVTLSFQGTWEWACAMHEDPSRLMPPQIYCRCNYVSQCGSCFRRVQNCLANVSRGSSRI